MTDPDRSIRLILAAALLAAAVGCKANSTAPTSIAPFSQTDLVVGTGATANTGNRITVSYSGWLHDSTQPNGKGMLFETNPSYSFVLGTGGVIKGWDQGIVGMKVGGQRRLVIPPELAYGAAGAAPKIPPNATIVFEIRLLGVG